MTDADGGYLDHAARLYDRQVSVFDRDDITRGLRSLERQKQVVSR